MKRTNTNDLHAFLAVSRERSFTKAAAKMGVSTSALSHSIRGLETRLSLRLLTRTTRSVSLTEAGERLLHTVGPRLEEIENELEALGELRGKPAGTIRIACSEYAIDSILWPKLRKFLRLYPDVKIEASVHYGKIDIVPQRYDAGISFHEFIAKDMIAVRVSPDIRLAIVGSPAYFAKREVPKVPRDLLNHNCINLRMPNHDTLVNWDFEKGSRSQSIRVEGQLTFSAIHQMLQAALEGFGLAYLPEGLAQPYIRKKRLRRVLEDWCPPFPGYHLYYPSRRQSSPAFALLVDALRYRNE